MAGSASRHFGSSSAQRAAARGHRVRKRQPLGGFMGERRDIYFASL